MRQTTLAYSGSLLAIPLLLAHCGGGTSSDDDDGGKHNGGSSGMATSGSAGKAMSGGSSNGGTGGATTGGSGGSGAAGKASGGSGGSTGGTGGASGSTGGGAGSATGATGPSSGGTGGATTGGAGGTGGSMGGTGPAGSGGSGATGAAGMAGAATTCPDTDMNGKANWMPGASANGTRDYLRSCDIRLLNNNWGASALGCGSDKNQYSVFVNSDGSFGWNFNRGDCDTSSSNSKPDFPEIEFGVHPFGKGSSDATSPDFSSTTLLPLQIKNIQSASVQINNLNVQLQQSTSWDLTFELWVSQRDPINDPSPGVYAELMTFWGWQNGRYPEPPNGTGPLCNGNCDQVSAGTKSYKLEVQNDSWADGKWRYFQFRSTDGPSMSFNGKVDVKALVDYLVKTKGYSSDFWITRLEVGTEIDDLTQGKATLDSITFEVNGQTRTAGKK